MVVERLVCALRQVLTPLFARSHAPSPPHDTPLQEPARSQRSVANFVTDALTLGLLGGLTAEAYLRYEATTSGKQ